MKFMVTVPITGHVTLEVDVDDESGALPAFYARAEEIKNFAEEAEEYVWEFTEEVTSGNVCHAETHSIEVCRQHPAKGASRSR